MIQRIQTIYLFIVAVIATLPFYALPIEHSEGTDVFALNQLIPAIGFGISVLLSIIAIVLYQTRKNQFVLNRFNLLIQLFLLGFFVYRSLKLSGEVATSEKGIGMLIPVFSIVFLVLANRAIKKDEDLVKSVDRLR